MRKLFISALMLYGYIAVAQVEQSEVPKEVQNAAKTKYSNAVVSEWYQTDDGFEAMLDNEDGSNINAVFSTDGKFLYTYSSITEDALPEKITSDILGKYSEGYISDALECVKSSGAEYKVTVETDEKTLVLTYDKSGKLLNTKEVSSDF